jgi:biopolymer transport protein ExbB
MSHVCAGGRRRFAVRSGLVLAALMGSELACRACWAQDAKPAVPAAPAAAPAAPAAAAAQSSTTEKKSFARWVYDAEGIFFWPQLAISIILVGVISSAILGTMKARFAPDGFVAEFDQFVKDRKFNEAYELAKRDVSFLGRIVTAGLTRLSGGYQEAIEAMQEVGEEESMKFEHRLSVLAMIGNIATMVGLLGTVWGMVASFMVIGQSDVAPKPSDLARGVSQALVTTVWGLLQAIPAVCAFTLLKNLVAKRVLEVGITSERMMQRFKNVTAARKPETAAQPATA